MSYVIGLDFGNYNSFPCFISDLNLKENRLGGIVHDLIPPNQPNGIPSAFFYTNQLDLNANSKPLPWCGTDAVQTKARPLSNRIRLLKRHLGEAFQLDDRFFTYDEAITKVIQYCVRSANKLLQEGWLEQSNMISLSYPATYTSAQRERLIQLAEEATLEDGRNIKVFGTIAEPAAAALDYLATYGGDKKDCTVLTYDLGGGTFDLALVSAYPNGKVNPNGKTYYYDVINARGISNLGGNEFDEKLFNLVIEKIGKELSNSEKERIKDALESNKIELSSQEESMVSYFDTKTGELEYLSITREEFEQAVMDLVKKSIDMTDKMLGEYKEQKPDLILLTGGASQMPIIKTELEKAFPEYQGKIIYYRPSRAIAYGAARYGVNENPVQQRTLYDIGIRFIKSAGDKTGYVETHIPAGSVIPFTGEYSSSRTVKDGQKKTTFRVFEAKVQNPNPDEIDKDYTEIMKVILHHRNVKSNERISTMTRLEVDKMGRLIIDAYDLKDSENKLQYSVELKNLS